MNRKYQLIVAILIVSMIGMAGVAVLVNKTAATPPSGVNVSVIASGTLPEPVRTIMISHAKFNAGAGFGSDLEVPKVGVSNVEVSKVVTAKFVFQPGGSTGWHQHGGPVWAVVNSGNLTFYDESCKRQIYQAPSTFFEGGKETHKAVNEGTEPVEVYATFMLPEGGELLIDAPDPGTCSS